MKNIQTISDDEVEIIPLVDKQTKKLLKELLIKTNDLITLLSHPMYLVRPKKSGKKEG